MTDVRCGVAERLILPLLVGCDVELVPPIGANGIVHFNGTLYVANTTKMSVVSVPILPDGSAGTPTVIKRFEGSFDFIDGITADVHGNLYPLLAGRYELVRLNPHTGEEFFVFSCFNQDQHLDFVDFKNLNERLKANSIQEKLTNMWLDRAFGRDEFKKLYGQGA